MGTELQHLEVQDIHDPHQEVQETIEVLAEVVLLEVLVTHDLQDLQEAQEVIEVVQGAAPEVQAVLEAPVAHPDLPVVDQEAAEVADEETNRILIKTTF